MRPGRVPGASRPDAGRAHPPVAAILQAVPDILTPVGAIFHPVAHVLAPVDPILDAVTGATDDAPIAHVFHPVADIFTAIAAVLQPVPSNHSTGRPGTPPSVCCFSAWSSSARRCFPG